MNILLTVHLLIAAINLGIGCYVLSRNFRSPVNRSFFVFALGVAGWLGGMALFIGTRQFSFAIASFLGGDLVALGLALFSEFFPEGRVSPPRHFPLYFLPWLIIFILTPSQLFISSAGVNEHGYLEPVHGGLFPLWGIVIGAYLFWSFWKFLKKYKKLQGIYRVQLRYVIAGAGIFLTAGFLSNVLLSGLGIYRFNLIGPLFSVVFIGCVAYATVRHHFMDIRIVIKRGIAYALAMAAIGVIFFSAEIIIEKFYYNDEVVDIAAAMAGGLVFYWLKDFFAEITDPIFFRNDYDYADAVGELGSLLRTTINSEELLSGLNDFLAQTIKPNRLAFYLCARQSFVPFNDACRGAEYCNLVSLCAHLDHIVTIQDVVPPIGDQSTMVSSMRVLDLAAIVPLVARGDAIGIMFVGEKRSDDILRPKDIDLLGVISHQLGMALKNVQYYETIEQYNEELERKVAERTERIRALHEEQSKFLAEISHELQTPVSILKGNMEILKDKKGGEQKDILWIMESTVDRMARHVDHLLDVARLNFSKDKLRKTKVKIENVLEEICGDCSVLAEHKGVALAWRSDAITIAGDSDKLKEVTLNLISNALKYTFAGGSIALEGKKSGENAIILVSDTGSGIAPENLPHIFERFYRVSSGSSPSMGLGLHICRKIVEAHGGTITATSELGKGSCFRIVLPLFVPDMAVRADPVPLAGKINP